MSRHYRGNMRVDANQSAIVKTLRAVGATVELLSNVGKGCPDLMVGWRGRNWLIEVKDGAAKNKADRELRENQVERHDAWRGQVAVAKDEDEALAILGIGAATEPGDAR